MASLASIGEIAALATACCWVVTSLAFAKAGSRVGSLPVNLIRLVIALPVLCLFTYATQARAFPLNASQDTWIWLSMSGVVGFVVGDMCLFRAFVLIGPRLSSLIMATSPLMTALIGYFVLHETLGLTAIVGMTLTIAGVCWAVSDRKSTDTPTTGQRTGVLLALLGALGQAAGLVLSKYGMGDYDPFAATQIRIIAALLGWVLIFFITRRWAHVLAGLKDRLAMRSIAIGSVFGPVFGVSLSLYAVQRANTGVAASIMSITPILIIPVLVLVYRERVGRGGVLGAMVAVGGVAVLFLR